MRFRYALQPAALPGIAQSMESFQASCDVNLLRTESCVENVWFEAHGLFGKVLFRRKGKVMISRITLLKRKEGVAEEGFREILTKEIGAVAAEMTSLRQCDVNIVTDNEQRSWAGRGSIDIDGFVEMYFDSYADMVACIDAKGDELTAIYEKVAETPLYEFVSVRKVDTPVPAYLAKNDPIKRVSFCDRAEGVTAKRFHDEWWYTHSMLVRHMTGYCGYNQNLVIDRLEFFFENMDAFDECYGTPGFERRASPHAAEFIGTVTTYFVEPITVK